MLCPDLRVARWSSTPRSLYRKNDMADDLAAVLDRLGVGPVKLVAHDWVGPVAFIMMALGRWVGGGFSVPEDEMSMYAERMRAPGHAVAGSRWYRTFLTREMMRWLRGEFDGARVDVPVRWLHGTDDPVLTPDPLSGYAKRISDFQAELVDGPGHWIVQQRPDLCSIGCAPSGSCEALVDADGHFR